MKYSIIAVVIIFILFLVLGTKDKNSYSNIECYEDYYYFNNQLKKYPEGSDSWCEIKSIIDSGFFKDSAGVIHERENFVEILESINNE
jgi:hypothetical protein